MRAWPWTWTSERIDLVKLGQTPLLYVLGRFVWSGAWALAGRLRAVRLVEGSDTAEFFQDAAKLKGELEALRAK